MLWLASGLTLVLLAFLGLCWYYAYSLLHPRRQAACMTPAQLGLRSVPVSFPARDGVCLRGWWVPARHARGTIVLSHGYSGDCSPDLEYAPWLTRAGYNLLFFDYRGHGQSGGKFTTLGLFETRDLLGALDFLRPLGIERVGVLGFSMGAAVALMTAPLTDAIQCVVADCTFADLRTLVAHHAPSVHIPRFLAPIGATVVVACASLQARANLLTHTPERSIGRLSPRAVLIIQAGNDQLVPAAEAGRLYAAARPPKELWRVEGAEHRLVDKLAREEYERRVTAFFDQYLAVSPSDSTSAIQLQASLPEMRMSQAAG